MSKVTEKVKEAAVWVADKILPKSTKETLKEAAREASGVDKKIQDLRDEGNDAQADAMQKLVDEAFSGSTSASDIIKEAGGYDNVGNYTKEKTEKALAEAKPIDEQNRAGRFLEEENDEARNARITSAGTEDVSRRAAYQAARNTGANRAAASAIGGTPQAGNFAGIQAGLRNAGTSTQADYLNKLGYSQALDMQSSNLEKGAFLNNISAILGGAGQGAQTGISLAGGV